MPLCRSLSSPSTAKNPPRHRSPSNDSRRAQQVQEERKRGLGGQRGARLDGSERQGGGEEPDEQRQTEIQRGQGAEEHAEQEQGEALEEAVELALARRRGRGHEARAQEEVRDEVGEGAVQEGEEGECWG